tara:strand:+ start:199 stop:759 length:561 start_codon:yes stop_codon:yes gene_type:complete
MKIYEIDMGNSAEFNKQLADAKKKEQELKVLAGKAKQMYAKAMQNYEEVEEKNAEKFDEEPTGAFNEWFKFMFKANPADALKIPGFTLNDNNVKKITKLLTAYASQNYFLKPKTPFAGAQTFLKIVKAIDPELVSQADTIFGRYVRGEEQKNPGQVSKDMKAALNSLTPDQRKQLQGLLDKAGGKA